MRTLALAFSRAASHGTPCGYGPHKAKTRVHRDKRGWLDDGVTRQPITVTLCEFAS
jgi:hypothetical protein